MLQISIFLQKQLQMAWTFTFPWTYFERELLKRSFRVKEGSLVFFTKGVAKNVQQMDPPCWQSMFTVCDGTKPQVCVSSGSAVTFMLQMPPHPKFTQASD